MSKFMRLLSLFVVIGSLSAATAYAEEAPAVKISGFADIIIDLSDEALDDVCADSDGKPANCAERKTSVVGEVDFEKQNGPLTFRLDLDIPSIGNEAAGTAPRTDIGIEQAKFIWAVPGAEAGKLTLTGGIFNAPIGFEAQDAPDMLQTTNGQLWALVPANLAGVMFSGGAGPVAVSVYAANEWRANDAEENSMGGLLTLTPVDIVSLSVGYLTSPDAAGAVAPAVEGDGNVLDAVATLTVPATEKVNTLLAVEFLQDEHNSGLGVTANVTHNTSHPHGLTIRYDSVDCDLESIYCGGERKPTSLTVAGNVALAENLTTVLEWRSNDPDISGVDATDVILLEFIATF